jgi:carbon storage regulator
MLILSRKVGESIRIGDDVVVTVTRVGGGKVRVAIEAPPQVSIRREELKLRAPRLPRLPRLRPARFLSALTAPAVIQPAAR